MEAEAGQAMAFKIGHEWRLLVSPALQRLVEAVSAADAAGAADAADPADAPHTWVPSSSTAEAPPGSN